ncbi:Transportin-PC [Thamnocephalis sphaerospora]|uniref:Transportin-PC n=1 Tax=Thamnocephalis sphaerospora TaxID=78915 RepID=A0A4P9XLR7_9FUNG|nr:Transportin-PC [Thamnocephalis sphaerospora]|eukprot:RKP06775.1 Transportin-PC [Thamnocephalis sphaerospora]
MEWKPQPEGLQQLLQLLRDSVSPDNAQQMSVQEKLKSFNAIPDYNNYLIYIMSQMPHEDTSTRTIAGLVLKNNIRTHFEQIQPAVLEYVKQHCLTSIADADPMVRSTVGIVITTVVARAGLTSWPQVLPRLMELLDSQDYNTVEGAFSALEKICEDSTRDLDKDHAGVHPASVMIPKFISFFQHENTKLRVHALICINQFIVPQSPALFANIDAYLVALFTLATDQHADVRKHVCHALVMLLEVRPDVLLPHINNIVEYMLHSTQEEDEAVALEACEFWLTFAEQDQMRDHLLPYLPRIVPILLRGMVYNEMDILTLLGDAEDESAPDREEDIKPRHYHSKQHEHKLAAGAEANGAGAAGQGDDEDDEDDEDYDDEDDDEIFNEWNLRKCSAAAIDVLATVFESDILESLLPLLKEKLYNQDWKERESGILALGAVADGCMDGMRPHLPTLVPFLLQSLGDSNALVRSITCWTIGRYSEWIVTLPNDEERRQMIVAVIEGLMRMVLDNNKRVQEAGCSAFATFEEEACEELVPYLDPIITNLAFAFKKYQRKNMLILFDAIGTLADSVGAELSRQEYVDKLMPMLLEQWQKLPDNDRDLFALLECLASVAVALGPSFQPFAGPVWDRSLRIINGNLMQGQACVQDPTLEPPDQDFLIVSLDLLSGLVQGLGPHVEALVLASQPPLLPLLGMCMRDASNEVRQSAYALLGDMAISCFKHIEPHLEQIMPELISQIDPTGKHVGVCNNASWAAGEISMRAGAVMQKWINWLLERLIPLVTSTEVPRSLHENASITVGRLGLVCPTLVAPQLESFAKEWCDALKSVQDDGEKESAFRGLCEVIQANPNGMLKCFYEFCEAILQWQAPSAELNDLFGKILHAYKGMLAAEWDSSMACFPQQMRMALHERYGV